MKNLFAISIALMSILSFTSCNDDETTTVKECSKSDGSPCDEIFVRSNITSDVTWGADSIYVLAGRIAVTSGATLTIEAGTIIKAEGGTGVNATALVVAKGAKLMAQGTASAPIIFTSLLDEIEIGDIDGPNLSDDVDGLWGGIIVLGNAPIFIAGDGPVQTSKEYLQQIQMDSSAVVYQMITQAPSLMCQ